MGDGGYRGSTGLYQQMRLLTFGSSGKLRGDASVKATDKPKEKPLPAEPEPKLEVVKPKAAAKIVLISQEPRVSQTSEAPTKLPMATVKRRHQQARLPQCQMGRQEQRQRSTFLHTFGKRCHPTS
ncbi:hypothetical protein IV203_019152 [Nitzschia inconspicua]|uniref:Uncharacterized protein n=1 Tax=Nitzschia inconspicua TaxID=303405 RepID=A0A9K3LYM9_9STRA|nr:hypothetical protein IV203_019152 [Nitzschia inconspicua]